MRLVGVNEDDLVDEEGWTALHHCIERSAPAFGDRAQEMSVIFTDAHLYYYYYTLSRIPPR